MKKSSLKILRGKPVELMTILVFWLCSLRVACMDFALSLHIRLYAAEELYEYLLEFIMREERTNATDAAMETVTETEARLCY